MHSPWTGYGQALGVLALCLGARLATTIWHIEDADSLRFALAMVDYDVTRLQPQFPGYPVFCFMAKCLYALLGSYALAFSALGGAGLFILIHYSLRLLKWEAGETRGIGLIALFLFNPMLWLMGNRYMSDLSGAACLLAAFYHLSRAAWSPDAQRPHAAAGFFLAGLQAGWRLSYFPFLAVPLLMAFLRPGRRWERLLAGVAGVLAWLLPLIAVTGWDELLGAARHQTANHFLDTGGTYVTEPDWPLRIARLCKHVWTDGLGAWWSDRHPVTLVVSLGAVFLLLRGAAWFRKNGMDPALRALCLSCAAYGIWILIFQNVVHQTRHVLPLVPPLLMLAAAGWPRDFKSWLPLRAAAPRIASLLFLAAYLHVGTVLALQHRRPAAIAQAKAFLEPLADPNLLLVSAPWVQKCLSTQGVRMDFFPAETPEELAALSHLDPSRPVVTVGDYSDRIRRPLLEKKTFYHNPYVNRLGSTVQVFRYAADSAAEPAR